MKQLRFIPLTAFLLAVIFAAGSSFTFETPKKRSQDCVWYKLDRAVNPNPDISVNTNYVKIQTSDIKAECPDEDVICAVCLPDNPGQVFPAASNFTEGFVDDLEAAELTNDETDIIELFDPE